MTRLVVPFLLVAGLLGLTREPSTSRQADRGLRQTAGTDGDFSGVLRVRFAKPEPAKTRVETRRGGTLQIQLAGQHPGPNDRLVLVRNDEVERSLHPEPYAQIDLRDLPPGKYTVRVETPWAFDQAWLRAEANTTLAAGGLSTVLLTLGDGPPRTVPFSGTIDVPAAWGKTDIELRTTTRRRKKHHARCKLAGNRWSFGHVPPGRYSVSVRPLSLVLFFDVPRYGTTDAHITIPPPADIELRLVGEDGKPVSAEVEWACLRPDDSIGHLEPARERSAPDICRFRAPATRIQFFSWDMNLLDTDRGHVLWPGLNVITLQARRPAALGVETQIDGSSVRVPDGFWFSTEAMGHDGEGIATEFGWNRVETLSAPGRYHVTFKKLKGYRAIPPFDLDLPRGITTLVVDLERE